MIRTQPISVLKLFLLYYCTIFGSLSRNRYGIAPHKSLWSEIMPSWQDFLSDLLAQSCIFQRKSPIYPYVLYRNGLKNFFDNADDMSDLNTIINISLYCHYRYDWSITRSDLVFMKNNKTNNLTMATVVLPI